MMTATDWLATWHSNGVELSSAELMYYRAHAQRLARRQPHPPRQPSGALLSKHKGRGMEFDEVRLYQPGDDVRSIDWRVTARTGSPHTKLYREERERPVLFVVDLSSSMQFGSSLLFKAVQAAHVCAALAWQAVLRGDRVGALLGGPQRHAELRPQARQHGVLRIINQLLLVQQQSLEQRTQQQPSNSHWSALLERAAQLAKPGTEVHLISDWLNTDSNAWLRLQGLRRHCQLQAWQIFDPLERQLPSASQRFHLALTDGQQQLTLPAYDQAQRQAYQRASDQQQQQLREQARLHQLSWQEISAAQPFEQQW